MRTPLWNFCLFNDSAKLVQQKQEKFLEKTIYFQIACSVSACMFTPDKKKYKQSKHKSA